MHIRTLSILFLVGSLTAQAQVIKSLLSFDEYEAGVGINTFIRRSQRYDKVTLKPGFSITLGLSRYLNKNFHVQPKFFYDKKGLLSSYNTKYFDSSTGQSKTGSVTNETFSNLFGFGLNGCIGIPKTKIALIFGVYTSKYFKGYYVRDHSWDNSLERIDFDEDSRFYSGLSLSIGYGFQTTKNTAIKILLNDNLNITNAKNSTITLFVSVCYKKISIY